MFAGKPMKRKLLKAAKDKRQPPLPTAAEMRLLQFLWELEEATVEDLVNAHSEKERPNYKTTQTFLRIMEQKGLVTHEARGRASSSGRWSPERLSITYL